MVAAARGVLNALLADVYIFTDAMSGKASGVSPGYGITLVAETTSGCLLSAQMAATQVTGIVMRPWKGASGGGGGGGRMGGGGTKGGRLGSVL